MLLAVGVASASATSSIEGVWSFTGGQIAIQPEGNGKFEGIVVSPTTFATCVHPNGQKIWKEITPQSDGSYWGLHQWYYENSSPPCELNPTFGPTAWRVIGEPKGSRYLRVCLSEPGKSQPTIPPESAGNGASYGCVSSALIAALPASPGAAGSGAAGLKERLTLPSTKKCLSLRLFKIHLADPKYDPLKNVSVTLKGRKIATSRKGKYVVAMINLKNLPLGAFTIKIHTTTVLGHHLSASRTYHTCIKKIKPSGKKKPGKKG